MNRSQYDGDVTTWSPQGRIFQIEYAMEAVKQGSACVGLKTATHAVLVALMRSPSELGAANKKVFRIDDHVGIAIAGLTADARMLTKIMRSECINHKFTYDEPLHTARLVGKIADMSQVTTQKVGRRPYGVGLLVASFDQTGAHIYETSPSGNAYDYKAQSVGARSQSARTYLEKNFDQFHGLSRDDAIQHALRALRETVRTASDGLSSKNVAIGIVGKDEPFHILELEETQAMLDEIETADGGDGDGAAAEGEAAREDGDATMQD